MPHRRFNISIEEQIAYFAVKGTVFIYVFLFLSSVTENLFPPWPGDTVTLVGIYFAITGKLSFPVVAIIVNLGGLTGAIVLYYLGKTKGRKYFLKPGRKYFNAAELVRVENWMLRFGSWVIVGGRFLTGVRSLVSIIAGIGNINWRKFSVLTLLGFIIWNGILMYAVYLMRGRFNDLGVFLSSYSDIILVVVAVAVTVYLVTRYIQFTKGNN